MEIKTDESVERKVQFADAIESAVGLAVQSQQERDRVLGTAKADAKEREETARSSLYQMKMEAFRNDAVAFQRGLAVEEDEPVAASEGAV